MAKRFGKYKVSKKESELSLRDGGKIEGNVTLSKQVTVTGNSWATGSVALPYVGLANSSGSLMEIGGDYTLVLADHAGKTVVATAAATVTLPAVGLGASLTIVNGVGGVLLTIEPNSSDKYLWDIAGAAGTNDKGIINTAVTAKAGDFVTILGMTADGWAIVNRSGTWVDE